MKGSMVMNEHQKDIGCKGVCNMCSHYIYHFVDDD